MTMHRQLAFYKFVHKTSVARLTIWEDEDEGVYGHISGVYSRIKGQGYASEVLRELIAFADKKQLALSLEVSAYGSSDQAKLSNEQLVQFYTKFGFVVDPDYGMPILMERVAQIT